MVRHPLLTTNTNHNFFFPIMMFAAIALKLAKKLVQLFEVSVHFHPYHPLLRTLKQFLCYISSRVTLFGLTCRRSRLEHVGNLN